MNGMVLPVTIATDKVEISILEVIFYEPFKEFITFILEPFGIGMIILLVGIIRCLNNYFYTCSRIPNFLSLAHPPRVKSGNFTGADPSSIEISESGPTTLHEAPS